MHLFSEYQDYCSCSALFVIAPALKAGLSHLFGMLLAMQPGSDIAIKSSISLSVISKLLNFFPFLETAFVISPNVLLISLLRGYSLVLNVSINLNAHIKLIKNPEIQTSLALYASRFSQSLVENAKKQYNILLIKLLQRW